jgi:hypothetical protein
MIGRLVVVRMHAGAYSSRHIEMDGGLPVHSFRPTFDLVLVRRVLGVSFF